MKNTQELINEFKKFLLNEVSLQTLETEMSSLGFEEQYTSLFERKSDLGNLKDPYFNMIILNTFKKDISHGIEEFVLLYREYSTHIQPFQRDREQLIVKLNDGTVIDFNEKLDYSKRAEGNVTATYEDLVSFINIKLENRDVSKKKTQQRIEEELEHAISGQSNHFDFICEDKNYIVFYPKTQFSSRVIARSMFVGGKLIYDNSASTGNGKLTGKLTWCTSSSGDGNAFLSYKKGNKHMYYCLKKFASIQDVLSFVDSDTAGRRKLCISFVKRNNKTGFAGGHACVNGNNQTRDEKWFKNTLGDLFNSLYNDASGPERLDFDQIGYFKSINLAHYRDLRKTAGEEEINDFLRELGEILSHSHAKNEIAEDVLNDTDSRIRDKLTSPFIYKELNNDLKSKVKNAFIYDEDEYVRASMIKIANLDYVEDREIIDSIITSPALSDVQPSQQHISSDLSDQRAFFMRSDIHLIDPTLELLERIIGLHLFRKINGSVIKYYKSLYEKNPEKYYNENLLADISETNNISALENIIQNIENYKNSGDKENLEKLNKKLYDKKVEEYGIDTVSSLFTPQYINSHYNDFDLSSIDHEQLNDKTFFAQLEKNILPEEAEEINRYFNFYICYLADLIKKDFMQSISTGSNFKTNKIFKLLSIAYPDNLNYRMSFKYSESIKLSSDSLEKISDIIVTVIESKLPLLLKKRKDWDGNHNRKQLENVTYSTIDLYEKHKDQITDDKVIQNFERIILHIKRSIEETFNIPDTFKNNSQAKRALSNMLEKINDFTKNNFSRSVDQFDVDLFFKDSLRIIRQYGIKNGDAKILLAYSEKINRPLSKEEQLTLLNSLNKTDFFGQESIFTYAYIDKGVYITALERYLPKGGRGPSAVYSSLPYKQMIHTMMEDTRVANCIIDFSRKGFLDSLCNFYTTYLEEEWFRSHHAVTLSNLSFDSFYEALNSNPNALKSKTKRKNFIKAYEENKSLNESYRFKSDLIIENYIKSYLSVIT